MAQPGRSEARHTGCGDHRIHGPLVLGRGRTGEGQRHRPQTQVEDPVAQQGLVVVVALGLRGGDDPDLPAVQAEALLDGADLRLHSLRIRQEDAARAAFDDRGRDGRILDVRQALRGEDGCCSA